MPDSCRSLGRAERRPNTLQVGLLGLPPAFAGVDPSYAWTRTRRGKVPDNLGPDLAVGPRFPGTHTMAGQPLLLRPRPEHPARSKIELGRAEPGSSPATPGAPSPGRVLGDKPGMTR